MEEELPTCKGLLQTVWRLDVLDKKGWGLEGRSTGALTKGVESHTSFIRVVSQFFRCWYNSLNKLVRGRLYGTACGLPELIVID